MSSALLKTKRKLVVVLLPAELGILSLESSDLDLLIVATPSSLADWTTWTTQCFPGIRSQANAADFSPSCRTFSGIRS